MERLTSNKPVDEMSMMELAHNCCYAKDRRARYRDFSIDVDARELTRELLKKYAEGDDAFTCDEDFDEEMLDYLQYGTETLEGVIALFYQNLWAMADLRERLKAYEDAEEQGLLLRLPCKVGDTVWVDSRTVQKSIECYGNKKWLDYDELPLYFKARVVSVKIGRGKSIKLAIKAKYFYQGLWSDVEYNTEGVYVLKSYVFSSIGKTVFLTTEEAEQALKQMGE